MAVQVSYPGVYIEELPSGVHTVTGVATSITAFVGRAPTGPINDPITIFSFGDFERTFGGLSFDYPMSYAVQDFFANGGSQAVVVRLFKPKALPQAADWNSQKTDAVTKLLKALSDTSIVNVQGLRDAVASLASGYAASEPQNWVAQFFVKKVADLIQEQTKPATGSATPAAPVKPRTIVANVQAELAKVQASDVTIPAAPSQSGTANLSLALNGTEELKLEAASPGGWGNRLTAKVDRDGINSYAAQPLTQYGLSQDDLFNLTVQYASADGRNVIERFINLSIKGDKAPSRIDRVLADGSTLVRVPMDSSQTPPVPALPAATPVAGAVGSGGGGSDSDYLDSATIIGHQDVKTGLYSLETCDLFNLLCITPDLRGGDTDELVYQTAAEYCYERRAMLIIDPPNTWTDAFRQGQLSTLNPTELGITGEMARNAMVYFPRVVKEDLKLGGQQAVFPACGIIAGAIARTDVERGVWKAPAGQDAALNGIVDLNVSMTDAQNGVLNPMAINCLRNFPVIGPVVWGARTLRGADQLADDYKYISVRRLTLFIEESLYRATKWAVFEPNDETLWSQLRLEVGSFMADLGRQGAFYNYRVVCDATTTTQSDIDHGIVNVLVAFAPVKPAEFVVLQIQQLAGQTPA